jgi:hypothetical protein
MEHRDLGPSFDHSFVPEHFSAPEEMQLSFASH